MRVIMLRGVVIFRGVCDVDEGGAQGMGEVVGLLWR